MSGAGDVRLVVRDREDESYRHVVSGTEDGVDPRKAERVMSAMLRKMDTDRFYIDEEPVT